MGRGRAGRSQQRAGVEIMKGVGAGLSWLEGWRAPSASSLWLPCAPHIQVDPGLGSMQAACPVSLLRIGWKEP